jgi:hypothetical protein
MRRRADGACLFNVGSGIAGMHYHNLIMQLRTDEKKSALVRVRFGADL